MTAWSGIEHDLTKVTISQDNYKALLALEDENARLRAALRRYVMAADAKEIAAVAPGDWTLARSGAGTGAQRSALDNAP